MGRRLGACRLPRRSASAFLEDVVGQQFMAMWVAAVLLAADDAVAVEPFAELEQEVLDCVAPKLRGSLMTLQRNGRRGSIRLRPRLYRWWTVSSWTSDGKASLTFPAATRGAQEARTIVSGVAGRKPVAAERVTWPMITRVSRVRQNIGFPLSESFGVARMHGCCPITKPA